MVGVRLDHPALVTVRTYTLVGFSALASVAGIIWGMLSAVAMVLPPLWQGAFTLTSLGGEAT